MGVLDNHSHTRHGSSFFCDSFFFLAYFGHFGVEILLYRLTLFCLFVYYFLSR